MKLLKSKKAMDLLFIVILVTAGIVGYVFVKNYRETGTALGGIFTKYTPATVTSDTFSFSSKEIKVDLGSPGCGHSFQDEDKYICKTSNPVTFNVNIENGPAKTRSYNAGVVICKESVADCCNDPTAIKKYSANNLILAPDDSIGGSVDYTFTNTGRYKAYSAVECVFDAKIGCKIDGMKESVKYCSPDQYILIEIS